MLGRTFGKVFLLNCFITASAVMFSKRLDGFTFTSIWNVSLKECRAQCEARPKCQSVNYSRRRLECQLNIVGLSWLPFLAPAPGFVFTEIDQPTQTCGGTTCTMEETCVGNRDTGACENTECHVPVASPAHGTVNGNINNVGDNIKLECEAGYAVQIDESENALERFVVSVCLPTGIWNIPSFQCGECNTPLVSGMHGIDDSKLTASSTHQGFRPPLDSWSHVKNSRLMTEESEPLIAGSWSSLISNEHQYIQAEFTAVKIVRAIQTQGRNSPKHHQWVTTYKVGYSADCHTFTKVKDTSGNVKVFPGNFDQDTVVTNRLDEPVYAKCMRLYPVAWHGHVSLRFEILGCIYNV